MQQQVSDDGFETFWRAYPRKVGKPKARVAWRRAGLTLADVDAVTRAVAAQQQSEQWREGVRYIPHPTTYLNQRRFEDAPDPPSPPTARELEEAHRIRRNSRNTCPHDDGPCQHWRVCIDRIVARLRERRRGEA